MAERSMIHIYVECCSAHFARREELRNPDRSQPEWWKAHMRAHEEADAALGALAGVQALGLKPLYWSVDDGQVCGAYTEVVSPDTRGFALGLLDSIAEAAVDDAPVAPRYPGNFRLLVEEYGMAIVPLAMAAWADAMRSTRLMSVRFEDQSWPVNDDGEDIVGEGEPPLRVAPIDSDDDHWLELGFKECADDAEHATQIMRADIDDDLIQPLRDLIEERGNAARRILRGEW